MGKIKIEIDYENVLQLQDSKVYVIFTEEKKIPIEIKEEYSSEILKCTLGNIVKFIDYIIMKDNIDVKSLDGKSIGKELKKALKNIDKENNN